MIRLELNNTALSLDEKARLTIRLHNPAFDTALVSRAYSFPFSIPATGKNLRALGHINRIDVRPINEQLAAQLTSSAGKVIGGFVEVGSVRSNRIELTFKNEARNVLDTLSALNIQDIMPLHVIPQTVLPFWEVRPLAITGTPANAIAINGETYTPLTNTTADEIGNSLAFFINVDYPGIATYNNTTEILRIEPGDVDVWDISYTTNEFVDVDSVTVGQAREQNFRAWIESLLVTPDARFAFPQVYAPVFYSENGENRNPTYQRYLNWNRNGVYNSFVSYQDDETKGLKRPFIPFLRIAYILDAIAMAAGFTGWEDEAVPRVELEKMLCFNNVALEAYSTERAEGDRFADDVSNPPSENLSVYNYHAHTINVGAHAPGMTASAFLKAYATLRNARIEVEDNYLKFVSKKEQILNAPRDWSEFLTVDYELDGQQGEDLTYQFEAVEGDTYVPPSDQLEPKGQGTKIINLPRPLSDEVRSVGLGGNAIFCVTEHRAQSERFGIKQSITNLRPFWHAVSDTVPQSVIDTVQTYLMSTHLEKDATGTIIFPFALELIHEGDNLYDIFFKDWAAVERGRGCTFYLTLPIHRLTNVENWTNGRIYLYHDMGQSTVVPTTIEVQVRGARQGLVKMECLIIS